MFPVPFDVAIEIFLSCLPDDNFPPPHPLQAPLLLCHVCSSWRSIVSRCPLLWSKFLLDENTKFAREKLSLWEQNSKGVPLDVVLRACGEFPGTLDSGEEGDPKNKLLHQMTTFLIKNSTRIRRLGLFYEDYEWLEPFFALPDAVVPAMESLYLRAVWYVSDDIHIFFQAPNLRRVFLSGRVFLNPLDQITHLITQEMMPISTFASILSDCRALVTLSMWIDGEDDDASELPQRRITAAHLKTLILTCPDINHPSVFDRFDFPALATLRLCTEEPADGGKLQFIPETAPQIHFFSQLRNLHHLTLGWQSFTAEMIVSLLRLTPFLEELAVASQMEDYRAFITALTYLPNQTADNTLLPSLRSLTLFAEVEEDPYFAPDNAFTEDLFMTMLISRCPISSYLGSGSPTSSGPQLLPLRRVDLWIGPKATIDVETFSQRVSDLELGQLVVTVGIHKHLPDMAGNPSFSDIVPSLSDPFNLNL